MELTVTKDTRLDLYLVVETMVTRRVIEFGKNGVKALEALHELDEEPLTRSVSLYNRVYTAEGAKEYLVYQSVDVMPRWTTRAARERARAAMVEQRGAVGLSSETAGRES